MHYFRGSIKSLFISGIVFLTAGCSELPTAADFKPANEPMYNMTQSSQVLACVGAKVEASGGPMIDMFISDITDHTTPSIESGFLTKNAVMMMTTAVDRVGATNVQIVGRKGGLPTRRQVQIIGAFTELNRTTESQALSGDVALPGGVEFSVGKDRNYNQIALDVALSEYNRIVPGTATSVSIQIYGQSGDVTLTYDEGEEVAASVGGGFTAQEGFHAAERLLVETAVALVVSKFYGVDMTQCLEKAKNPHRRDTKFIYDKPVFDRMDEDRSLVILDGPPPVRSSSISSSATKPSDSQEFSGESDRGEQKNFIILGGGSEKKRVVDELPSELGPSRASTYSGVPE